MQQRGSSNKPEEIFITNLKLLGFDPLLHCKDTNIVIDKDTFTTRPNCIKAFEVVTYFLFNELDKTRTRRTFHDIWPITCIKDSLLYRARAFTWLADIRPDTLLESVPLRKSYFSDCRGDSINKIIMAFSTIVLERLGKQKNIVNTSNPKMNKSSLIKESIASSDRYKEIRLKAIDAKKRWNDEQADLVSQIESKRQRIQHHSHIFSFTTNNTITQLNQQYHNVKAYNERKAREESERLEQERIEKARIEQERREREWLEQQRLERERIEKERLEQERIEKERREKERLERERVERERVEQERIERELIEREQREKERLERERIEKERLERERIEQERIEQERFERERIEREQREKERLERERIEKERLERERIEQERIEQERIEKERIEKERIEKERIEKERIEKERIEKERIEKERIEKERIEQERIEKERREQERIEQELIEKERLEEERIKKERREQKRLEQQQLEQELIEKERLEQQQFEKERIEKERLERQRVEEERIKQDIIRQERVEQERLEEEKRLEKEKSMIQEKLLRDRLEQDRRYNDFRDKERRKKEPIHQVHHGSRKLDESSSEKNGEENKIMEKVSIVGQEERGKYIHFGQVFSELEVNGPETNNIPRGPERLPRKRTSEVLNSPGPHRQSKIYPSSPHTPSEKPTNATEVYQQVLHILNSRAEPNPNYIIPKLPPQIIPSSPSQSVSSVRPRAASTPPPKAVCPSPAKAASLSPLRPASPLPPRPASPLPPRPASPLPPRSASPLPPKSSIIDIPGNNNTANKSVVYPSPKRTAFTDTHTPSKPIGSSRTPNTSYTPNDEESKQVFQSPYMHKYTPSYQGSSTRKVYGSPMRTPDQLIPDFDNYPSPQRPPSVHRKPRSPFPTGVPSRPLNVRQIVYSPPRSNIQGIDDDDSDFDMESVFDIQEEEPPEWTPMRMKTPKRF
ncbi:HAUS augmin-like complex subunit 6 N-terminus-domain-containing protein [Helicostylum pulchrum]|nr:HAUS augmin-like complex subunit 6 N-terminus-domain-containing protein [Helicostylum pulchrum]